MAKKDELADGVRVKNKEGFEGVITKCCDNGTYEIKFDDGDDGTDYKAKDLTFVSATAPGPDTENDDVSDDLPDRRRDDSGVEEPAVVKEPVPEDDEESITITQTIKVSKSDVTLDSKTMADPVLLKKEKAKQEELAKRRRKTRLAKLKAKPLSRIEVRKRLLASRLRKVKARKPHNYRKEQLIAWAKEYEIIKNRPDSWHPGCVRAKKKKSAQDFIDELQIDDD